MRDTAKSTAVAAAAAERTCIVIGVDADGTVRVGSYRGWGQMSAMYAPRDAAWLRGAIGQILEEAMVDEGRLPEMDQPAPELRP